ncbi:MAG: hypothetical protein AAGC65_19845 [Mucilaginibacter sp.]|uniref:hypothetical protein n=1 Tax=Mucilaginibacter sp. TaxID=1882438 RepID=UPI0031A589BC
MELFKIAINKDDETFEFEVADFIHHEGERCKFEVYKSGQMVAGFEPGNHQFLHVCKNPGNIDEDVLHLIADKIEALNL